MSIPADTSAQAREAQLVAYRRMPPAQRLVAALEMSEEARLITVAGFRARHPEWSEADAVRATSRVLLGLTSAIAE